MPSSKIAVFCSGEGTNLQAILRATKRGALKAKVAVVVSDNPRAFCITRALRAGVPTVVIDPRCYPSRQGFDRVLSRVVKKYRAKLIVLAGFMRVLSPGFVRRYRWRILNIHPALLPSFPGRHGVQDALDYGVRITGVTVHFVDEKVDHGPILLQESIRVADQDTEETLLRRIHRVEHRIYPQAIQMALDGRVKVAGRKVVSRR